MTSLRNAHTPTSIASLEKNGDEVSLKRKGGVIGEVSPKKDESLILTIEKWRRFWIVEIFTFNLWLFLLLCATPLDCYEAGFRLLDLNKTYKDVYRTIW